MFLRDFFRGSSICSIKGCIKAHLTTQKILSGSLGYKRVLYVSVCLCYSYFHDAVPVVPRGHPEQREEGHAEVLKGGVSAQALAGVVHVAV